MSSVTSAKSSAHDLNLLQKSYEIGRFVHSFVTEDSFDKSETPWSDYSAHFSGGPNPYYQQTKAGLVLEEYCGMPRMIHTPYGRWHILGNGRGDWGKIMNAIKVPLGLEMMKGAAEDWYGYTQGPYWAITRWKDAKIEQPVERALSEYMDYDAVKEVWKIFSSSHGLSTKVIENTQPK